MLDNVEIVHLLDDPLLAVLPVDHPLAGREDLQLADLAADTWVDPPAGSEARRLLLQVCSRAGFIPRVAFESDEYTTVAQLVAAGAGVALIPEMALGVPPEGVLVRALAGPPLVPLGGRGAARRRSTGRRPPRPCSRCSKTSSPRAAGVDDSLTATDSMFSSRARPASTIRRSRGCRRRSCRGSRAAMGRAARGRGSTGTTR